MANQGQTNENQQQTSKIIACYYTDKDSNVIANVSNQKYVYINIISENMIGKDIHVNLSNVNHDFIYNGKKLKNDVLEYYTINADKERIKLKVVFTPIETIISSTVEEADNPDNYQDFDELGFELPPFSGLAEHYPKYGKKYPNGGINNQQFAELVGGKVQYNIDLYTSSNFQQGFANTCALRVSHTLNENKHYLPKKPYAVSSTRKRKWCIYRVADLEKYLTSNYGEAHIVETRHGNTVPSMQRFLGRKGIIIFDTRGTWSDATGHATLWDGEKSLGGNYESEYYFNSSKRVKLWTAR